MSSFANLREKRVLIVDDELELRRAIGLDFQKRGCKIFLAASGSEALRLLETESVDIVITDVRMPNGNGIELLKKIREKSATKPIVLLATGFSDLKREDAMKLGAVDVIVKPIDRKELLSILDRAVLS